MDMNGMHPHTGSSTLDALGLVLRVLLLSNTAVVAGVGLLRPAVNTSGRAVSLTAWGSALVASATSLTSIPLLEVSVPFAVTHAVLVLALPITLRWPTTASYLGFALAVLLIAETALGHSSFAFFIDTVYTGVAVVWFGLTALSLTTSREQRSGLRPVAVAVSTAFALLLAAATQVATSGILDRRLFGSGYGFTLLVIAAASIAVVGLTAVSLRDTGSWRVYRVGVTGVAVAFVAWTVLPGIPQPGELPVAGVARLAHVPVAGQSLPVLVTPHRPGRNLVHLPEDVGPGVTVEAGGQSVPAVTRPGSSGTWAEVELPSGRSDVTLHREDAEGSVEVDTGTTPGPVSAAGQDGPECASAALGGLVAGARNALATCPSDRLLPRDADALSKQVAFIARSAPSISILADESPRSQAATELVRSEAARNELKVSATPQPDDALVVVSGWSTAAERLKDIAAQQSTAPSFNYGLQLAPWLLHSPVVTNATSVLLPLRFDPREQRSLEYGMTLAAGFGTEPPSIAGFDAWLATRNQNLDGKPVSIYASAQVDVMKMDMPGMAGMTMHGSEPGGQWIPRGTVVAISPSLTR